MNEPVNPAANRMPERMGRYRILDRLGKGAMGVVYRARDDEIERDVAIKVMMSDAEGEDTARERFFREARVTGRLLHRNIVTVFNAGEDNGRHFIVMELLHGVTLAAWMQDAPRTLEQKLDLMIQTCDGLAIAHTAGVTHRDVKPSNLFVQLDGTLKILDFGIARLASSSMTRSGLIFGTPDYMSPEQARGREVDSRSDIFSSAAVFYHLLALRKPFAGTDYPVVLQRVVNEEPPPLTLDDAPAPLAKIVTRGLSKAPEQRYQTMAELVGDLVRFKRQYEAETRQMTTAARAVYNQLLEQAGRASEMRARLELGPSPAAEAAASLGARYSALRGGPPTPGLAAPSRPEVIAMGQDVAAAGASVSAELESLRAAASALDAADEALQRGHGLAALDHLRTAERDLGIVPPRLQAATLHARELVADHQAREDHLRTIVADARAAEKNGQWDAVLRQANDALRLRPDLADAQALAAKANAALNADREAREKRVHRMCEQAAAALQAGHLDQAEQLLREATRTDPAHAAIPTLAARLEQARAEAAAHDERLRAESAAVAAAEAARSTEAAALAKQAEAHWKRGEVDAALAAAASALQVNPSQTSALRVQELAQSRLRAIAEKIERRREGDVFLKRAVGHLAQGRFDRAADAARAALELLPDRADAASVLADATRLTADAQAEDSRVAALRDRSQRIEQLVRRVRVCLRLGDYTGAVAAAEEAARLHPAHPGVPLLLAQSRATLAATGAADPEATVAFDRPAAVATVERRATLGERTLTVWLRLTDWVGDVRRAWQATRFRY